MYYEWWVHRVVEHYNQPGSGGGVLLIMCKDALRSTGTSRTAAVHHDISPGKRCCHVPATSHFVFTLSKSVLNCMKVAVWLYFV